MTEIVINKERYECPPAVAAYIKQLERNNLNLQEEFYKQGTKKDELKAENARLEESFQRATGAVAADALPTLAEMRKVSEMCRKSKCDNWPGVHSNKSIKNADSFTALITGTSEAQTNAKKCDRHWQTFMR